MYAYIKGKLVECAPSHVVIDVGGVGYRLAITTVDSGKLPPLGEEICFHTTLIIRENEHTLYGFIESANRDLFETLTTITGIGPKTALSILGSLPLNLLQQAVAQAEPKLLAKVPGIGKKTAERLLIELKDRLPKSLASLPQGSLSSKVEDAIGALSNLGYNRLRAQQALRKPLEEMGDDADLAALISSALRNI